MILVSNQQGFTCQYQGPILHVFCSGPLTDVWGLSVILGYFLWSYQWSLFKTFNQYTLASFPGLPTVFWLLTVWKMEEEGLQGDMLTWMHDVSVYLGRWGEGREMFRLREYILWMHSLLYVWGLEFQTLTRQKTHSLLYRTKNTSTKLSIRSVECPPTYGQVQSFFYQSSRRGLSLTV